jgi:hypothetical protein
MTLNAYDQFVSEPECVDSIIKFVGGSAAVTKVYGAGVTVTYVSTGLVDLVFGEDQGTFVGFTGHMLSATTMTGIAGYTIAAGTYDTATRTVRVSVYNASDALADLAALQWLTLRATFKRTAVAG